MRKVFCAVLNERLCEWVERAKVLSGEPDGFCADRGAQDDRFVVNVLIEKKIRDF